MTLPPKTAEARSDHNGQTVYFCYAGCKTLFDWDPEKYLAKMDRKETHPS